MSQFPIKAAEKTVEQLLSNERYLIDYYQREYKWGTKQIKELIEDLSSKFLENYSPSDSTRKVQEYSTYFLGSIVLSEKDGEKYIIDGQQRMTSLTLLVMYVMQELESSGAEESKELVSELKKLVFSNSWGEKSFNISVGEREGIMKAILEKQSHNFHFLGDEPESVQNIYDRYNDILSIFPEQLDSEALLHFGYWLKGKVQIITITAYSDEEAYTIFETMNDRGLSLTPIDMLKGFLLASIEPMEKRNRAAEVWKDSMLLLVREIGNNAPHEFFRDLLRGRYAVSTRNSNSKNAKNEDYERVSTEFHRWARDKKEMLGLVGSEAIFNFICAEIKYYANLYVRINKASTSFVDGLENVCYLSYSDLPQPLLNALMFASIEPGEVEYSANLKMNTIAMGLDVILFKRYWQDRQTTEAGYRATAFNMMKYLRGKNINQISAYMFTQATAVGLGNFDNSIITLSNSNKKRIYRILARLTDFVEQHSGRQVGKAYFINLFANGQQAFDIEHVLAQNNGVDIESLGFSSREDFAIGRNQIGGLLLLPKKFNSSYNNKPYGLKAFSGDGYPSQNMLAATLSPNIYNKDNEFLHASELRQFSSLSGIQFTPYENFSKSSLQERGELYINIARKLWNPDHIISQAEDIQAYQDELLKVKELVKNQPEEEKASIYYGITIKDLIDANILIPNEAIYTFPSGLGRVQGAISQSGEIEYDGVKYSSPSGAGKIAHGKVSLSGWEAWYVERKGSLTSIEKLRDAYRIRISEQ